MNAEDIAEDGGPAGWTERFGVHPDHRGRGIALALLSHSLRAMCKTPDAPRPASASTP